MALLILLDRSDGPQGEEPGSPPPSPAGTFTERVAALSPAWHLPLDETVGTTATAEIGANGTYTNSPQLGVDTIVQFDTSGKSTGLDDTGTASPHIRSTSPLSGTAITIDLSCQLDSITKEKHVLITRGQGAGAGGFSLEVLSGGIVRAFSTDSGGTARPFQSAEPAVTQGTATRVAYRRQSGVAPSQEILVNDVVVASDPNVWTWSAVPAGTVYIGTWFDPVDSVTSGTLDGLISHVVGWNSWQSNIVLQQTVLSQSVAWAVDIDAGSVVEDASTDVSVLQGGWHGKTPVTVSCGNGSLFTTTESADEITIAAGSTPGSNSTASFTFTDANGNTTASKTLTVDVTEAAAPGGDVTAASVAAFGSSRQDVTALEGWPAGRTPDHIVSQGTHVHGYVRRSWKLISNNGNFIDFQAGWRKTSSADTIRVALDNGTELDINISVTHSIPSPGSGGTTLTLDALGGGDFTTWTSAIAGVGANDVLVVRARAGGEVYPVDSQTSGAISTVNGVKVVAHPDDLAAGRRPRVHVQGTTFARYADDLNNGHWELHQNLGGVHGTVWKTTAVVGTNKVNVGIAYRARSGRIKHTYVYRNTAGTPGALARLTDTAYPRIGVDRAPAGSVDFGTWDLYMGPGHYLHSDGKLYIRLSGVTNSVGAKQVNVAAGLGSNPPWDWSDDFPESENPNLIPLYISSTNDRVDGRGAVSTGLSYCLRINGRSNWLIENIDFVGGGSTIEMWDSSGHTLRGCRVLGWAPPNVVAKDDERATYERTHNMIDGHNCLNLTLDRCEFWGGQCPWYSYAENKAWEGSYGASMKANLFEVGANGDNISVRFLNCILDGFPTPTRQTGTPIYIKFHNCEIRLFGIDGAFCCECPTQSLEYIRCTLYEGTLRGYVDGVDRGTLYLGYNLWTNFRPAGHKRGYWATSDTPNNNHFMCNNQCIGHSIGGDAVNHYYYNNTAIGSHNHITAAVQKTSGSGNVGAIHDGAGAQLFPNTRNQRVQEFMTRNNILAVRPNGSIGGSPPVHGPGRDSHVAVIPHINNIGHAVGGASSYSMDFNMYHRGAGMPTLSGDHFNSTFTLIASGGGESQTNAIATVRSTTGQENNGRTADPLFVGVWDAGKLDRELHDIAFWMLQSGSPARTGGDTTNRSWRDVDFGAETTYGGNTWLGALDPDGSAVEQQVGTMGPMMTPRTTP